jgi:hypothetical protein
MLKTVLTLGAAVVLVTALGSASYAQQNQYDWQRAYNSKTGKGCVGSSTVDENAASAYPSWWTNCR